MATAELISLEQYLHMSFEHDAEFVEGRIVERVAPYWEHSSMQGFLIGELWPIARRLGWITLPEQRVQTRPDRIRVPDVCIIRAKPEDVDRGIVTRPPYLCVEILLPEDTMIDKMEKIREYLGVGVEWVWIIDPASLFGQVHSRSGVVNVEGRIFKTDRFNLDVSGVEF